MSIICGDCLEEMRKMEDNSVSAIVTDPPYGLSFMGKGWDHAVPIKDYWIECFRITRPGSFLIAMGGTRTFHRLACAIEDAGYQIRDCISWLYGSGFPKSHNHFGLEGYGSALKPAWEPCILAMKPLDGTFKQNAEKWGQAGINIDGCRVETEDQLGRLNNSTSKFNYKNTTPFVDNSSGKGRWPSNVILDDEAGKMLDEQTGHLSGAGNKIGSERKQDATFVPHQSQVTFKYDNGGGASRFFYCAKASSSERNDGLEGLPKIHKPLMGEFKDNPGRETPKSSPTPRQNHHPTVKPLKLMEYLIKLVMPPKDGILLDPFAGSGTTILAAHCLGLKAIGIEKYPEYVEIARTRLANATIVHSKPQMDLFEACE
jgi:DNA modification methylase